MDIWERQIGETALAYEWFCRYRDMGPERSLSKVVQEYNRNKTYKTQLAKWSIANTWTSRVEAYDQHFEIERRAEMENEKYKSAREDVRMANNLLAVLNKKLPELEAMEMNATHWKALAEFAVKTRRDALGIADKYDISGSIDVQDKTAHRISSEFMERTERLLAQREDGVDHISP